MFKGKLLLMFVITLFFLGSVARRIHFEEEAPAASTNTTEENKDASAEGSAGAAEANKTEGDAAPAAVANDTADAAGSGDQAAKEGEGAAEKTENTATANSTTSEETTTATATTTAGEGAANTTEGESTAANTTEGEATTTTSATTTATTQTNGDNVPISDLPTLTTKQLTLNLSNLNFPNPKAQGDTLNLSAISISSSTPSNKCKAGYTFSQDSNNCQLADILLMTNLDAENLILGDLNLEDLKAKQAEFKAKHADFTAIECSGETPFLSKQGCIACKEPNTYFSLKSLKCSRCPENATYNAQVRNCETGGTSSNETETKGESNETTGETPAKTGDEQTTTTTTTTKTTSGAQFLSNVNANNYLVLPDQSFDDFKNEVENAQKENSSLQVCPEDKPYSTGSECISCPADQPLFFIASKSCTSCKANGTYSPSIHSCRAKRFKITTITKTSNKLQENQNENESKKEKDDSSSSDDKKKKNDDDKSDDKQADKNTTQEEGKASETTTNNDNNASESKDNANASDDNKNESEEKKDD